MLLKRRTVKTLAVQALRWTSKHAHFLTPVLPLNHHEAGHCPPCSAQDRNWNFCCSLDQCLTMRLSDSALPIMDCEPLKRSLMTNYNLSAYDKQQSVTTLPILTQQSQVPASQHTPVHIPTALRLLRTWYILCLFNKHLLSKSPASASESYSPGDTGSPVPSQQLLSACSPRVGPEQLHQQRGSEILLWKFKPHPGGGWCNGSVNNSACLASMGNLSLIPRTYIKSWVWAAGWRGG